MALRLNEPIDFLEPGTPVDLTNCHREPIHTPGAIQPHGVLLAAGPDRAIVQVSANAAAFLGCPLGEVIDPAVVDELAARAETTEAPNLRPVRTRFGDRAADAFGYRDGDALIVELEFADEDAGPSFAGFQEDVTRSVAELQDAPSIRELLETAARVVRRLTGFDRVWAYRFEPDDHGVIVAEEKHDMLPAFLGLHYPASDIPPAARALFLQNRLRFIRDANAHAVPLLPQENPVTGAWLNLAPGVLRAVSPIHIRYLQNMGATASMSIALSVEGRLWGLISAHHYSGPVQVSHGLRAACEFIGLVCSMQLAAKEDLEASEYRVELGRHRHALLERVAGAETIAHGLAGDALLAVCAAQGAAVRIGDELELWGDTPAADDVLALLDDLREHSGADLFATDSLARDLPAHAHLKDDASGVLAAPLAHEQGNYVVWFRPERVRTVTWGGASAAREGEASRLEPRGSFRTWAESVENTSRPWSRVDVESVSELRASLGTFVLDRAEQLAALNSELARSNAELDSFAYAAAHDLKEPLSGIRSFAGFVIEDYADALDAEGRERLGTVMRLAERMTSLLESLLEYSRVGRAQLDLQDMTLGEALDEACEMLQTRLSEPGVELRLTARDQPLRGDRERVRHLLVNLIANALKYNDKPERRVEVGAMEPGTFYVRDNGIGIAPEHHEAIFTVFRRLHTRDAYGGGTGAGLTIARRIAERHGGRLWVEASEPGDGTTFCFTLEPT